ncbi:hypothetical protein IGI04_027284 [Brassica rapa subsp. trilocularis]|uniref:Protein kinase domain-containing protein n=1 Tax=Brassica rapa subsp. trilocularis TaxID=1813537 RepID=A0ABQ7KYR4_BRACM|nr:hypothetical protein IGI04_027284 [Brassica rapa subsp. trilocularis]
MEEMRDFQTEIRRLKEAVAEREQKLLLLEKTVYDAGKDTTRVKLMVCLLVVIGLVILVLHGVASKASMGSVLSPVQWQKNQIPVDLESPEPFWLGSQAPDDSPSEISPECPSQIPPECPSQCSKDSWAHLPLVTGSSHTRSATSLPSDLCRRFTIEKIKSATNDFEKELIVGVGGFGPVYKGRIDDGTTLVAVKRLEISSNQGAKQFDTELEMLTMLRHIHLVSLIGYCEDENEMVLVYEYMPHGTLRDHLYKRNKAFDPPLSWTRRLEICIGAARGLQYLHTGAKHMIIHRDIKTTNILLDENYIAKVSDFGLSKVGPTSASQTHVSTVVKGSFGYLDPEYYRRQVLTEKSDVYSFGVVLFEVLCCRPVKLENFPREEADLVRWVKSNYKNGTVDQIVDADLTADITPVSLEKFCEIAVRCVQDRGTERPPMNDVVWALEFALQLHEAATNKNGVDSLDLPTRGEVGTTTEGEDDLFSTTNDVSACLARDEKSWGVFSEIKEPKAR